MPLNPTNPPAISPLPMFERGQASNAALYNLISQKSLDTVEAIRLRRVALETQITNLEGRITAASPQFAQLLADANSLNSQINASIAANSSSNIALDNIQNNLSVNDQNATIQLNRIAPITQLIDQLTIGQEIQGYSDLLNRIAAATRLASRILGTDASGNVVWRAAGSVGSGVLLRSALLVRRLADNAGGGGVAALQTWNPTALSISFNTIGLSYANNQISVPAGEYIVFGFVAGCSNGFQCRLRNVSNNSTLAFGTPAKGTTATAISASNEPLNFLSKLRATALISSNSNLELQTWYDTAANTASNTQSASAGIAGYAPQQSALVLLRVVY